MLTLGHLNITVTNRAPIPIWAASIINTAKSRHVPLPRVSVSFGS